MLTRAKTFQTAVVSLVALLPACAAAEGFDTEHIFGFMIGADVGSLGEREFQTETTGRLGRNGGRYSPRYASNTRLPSSAMRGVICSCSCIERA